MGRGPVAPRRRNIRCMSARPVRPLPSSKGWMAGDGRLRGVALQHAVELQYVGQAGLGSPLGLVQRGPDLTPGPHRRLVLLGIGGAGGLAQRLVGGDRPQRRPKPLHAAAGDPLQPAHHPVGARVRIGRPDYPQKVSARLSQRNLARRAAETQYALRRRSGLGSATPVKRSGLERSDRGSLRQAQSRQSAASAQGRQPKPRCPHQARRSQQAQLAQRRVRHHAAREGR